MLFHTQDDVVEDFGQEGLISFAKGKRVAVLLKSIDEILSEVRTAYYAQLAEEGQATAVQAHGDVRPRPAGSPALLIGPLPLATDLPGLLKYSSLLVFRKVVIDSRVADQPLIGRVEAWTVGRLSTRSKSNQIIQDSFEIRVNRWCRQRRGVFLTPVKASSSSHHISHMSSATWLRFSTVQPALLPCAQTPRRDSTHSMSHIAGSTPVPTKVSCYAGLPANLHGQRVYERDSNDAASSTMPFPVRAAHLGSSLLWPCEYTRERPVSAGDNHLQLWRLEPLAFVL